MSARMVPALFGGLLFGLMVTGCSRAPQFQASSRELLKPLQTAVSAKKLEWIEATEKKIQEQRDAGDVSDTEFHALNGVIRQARSGDWTGAQQALTVLIDGQRPSAEDAARLKEGVRANREKHRQQAGKRQK